MRTRQLAAVVLVVALGALLLARPWSRDEAAVLQLGDPVVASAPDPTGDVVLTLTVDGETSEWDVSGLGVLPQHELTIVEPFVDRELTFTGPRWVDVLRASGVDVLEDDRTVILTALDDFVVELPVAATVVRDTVLAIQVDGAPIEIVDGGPIRLVYPDGAPLGENVNHWIWSLRSGEVR